MSLSFVSTLGNFTPRAAQALPGLLGCVTVALAAAFISAQYGGPLMLYALLFGMAFNFLHTDSPCLPGIELCSRNVLRIGVALLGVRITWSEVQALGWMPIVLVLLGVSTTIFCGWLAARWLGLTREQGLLSGGAVAICGASAAMALSALLPRDAATERMTLLTVISVTALSTLAMVVYPLIAQGLNFDVSSAGALFGATIHDVAQVVGAGYLVSPETADVAALVKLMRIAMLVPVLAVFSWLIFRPAAGTGSARPHSVIPTFLLGFVILVACNSLGWIPPVAQDTLGSLSRGCLVVAIAAIGMKTSLQQLAAIGWRPVGLIVTETVFLCVLALVFIALFF